MNRNERRLARRLGAHWVKIRHNATVEVCWGGDECGCEPGGAEGGRRAGAQRRAPTVAPGGHSGLAFYMHPGDALRRGDPGQVPE